MTHPLSIQDFSGQTVRVYGTPEAPLFVAADICRVLDIANSRDAVAGLDEDEKASVGITDTSASSRNSITVQAITESGLYHLIFKSRKSEAKAFRRWVTGTVLPSIRQTGGYAVVGPSQGALQLVREFIALGANPDIAIQAARDILCSIAATPTRAPGSTVPKTEIRIVAPNAGQFTQVYGVEQIVEAVRDLEGCQRVTDLQQYVLRKYGMSKASFFRYWPQAIAEGRLTINP